MVPLIVQKQVMAITHACTCIRVYPDRLQGDAHAKWLFRQLRSHHNIVGR